MNTIERIEATIIKDSRGKETISVSLFSGDHVGTFSVPSGASTGVHEVYELRDADGGMSTAVRTIHESIAPHILGLSVFDQQHIDALLYSLDSDPQKKTIGGNTLLAISGAAARLGASVRGIPLFEYLREVFPETLHGGWEYPKCYFNLVNGGKHAHTGLAFQEYHVVPLVDTVAEALSMGKVIYEALHSIVEESYGAVPLGDEGGYALPCTKVEEPLVVLKKAVLHAGYDETTVAYALDVAASSFFEKGTYSYNGAQHTTEELIETYKALSDTYPFISIEDPFAEEALSDFATLRRIIPSVKIIGDDLTVTNTERLIEADDAGSIDGLIIKPNQIGTLTETIRTINEAHKRNKVCIVSHRSGETMDDSIADIAVAFGCFGIKTGAPGPKERMVKYERLVAITSAIHE